MARLKNIQHLLRFLMNRKRLWLFPILIVLLLLGALMIFTHGTVLAPFVYTLF